MKKSIDEHIGVIEDLKSTMIACMPEPEKTEICTSLSEAIKALAQEPVIDKIREEIKQTSSRYVMSRERGYQGQVEWSDRLIKESEVLGILDKYDGNNTKN